MGRDARLRPGWRVFFFLLLALAGLGLCEGASITLAGGRNSPLHFLYRAALSLPFLALESWLFLSVIDQRSFRTLGLWFYPGWAKEAGTGLAAGAALIAVVGGVLWTGGLVRYASAPAQAGANPGLALSFWALALLLAAAMEELLFRGYGFQRLVDSVGRAGAMLIFSALFALGHVGNPGGVTLVSTANTVLAGVLLAVAYLKTRALWMPIALHWAWNFVMGPLLGMPVSGLRLHALGVQAEASGRTWLSGGSYGPEGSIFLTVACLAASLLLGTSGSLAPSATMAKVLEYEAEGTECAGSSSSPLPG